MAIKHNLTSKHSILSETEKQELLENLQVTIKEIPKIKVSDPAISELNANSGDIIKIERNSRSAGTSLYYRVVIE